jgi:hypothetical protein
MAVVINERINPGVNLDHDVVFGAFSASPTRLGVDRSRTVTAIWLK